MWVAVLAGVTGAAQAVGANYHNDFSLPGTESQQALDTLRSTHPRRREPHCRSCAQDPRGLAAPPTPPADRDDALQCPGATARAGGP